MRYILMLKANTLKNRNTKITPIYLIEDFEKEKRRKTKNKNTINFMKTTKSNNLFKKRKKKITFQRFNYLPRFKIIKVKHNFQTKTKD